MQDEIKNTTENSLEQDSKNAQTTNSDAAFNEDNVLDDIIDKKSNSDIIFNRYKDKTEIADKIAKVLFGKKYNSGKGNQAKRFVRGFFNTDMDRSQVGLLTQCLGMQSVASLNSFGLDMQSYSDIIDHTINDIFKNIGLTQDIYEQIKAMGDDIVFDKELLTYNMTPFVKNTDYGEDDDNAFVINTCVEAACNVLKALVEAREMILRQEYDKKPLTLTFEGQPADTENIISILEIIIKYTLGWLASACIKAKRTIHYSIAGKRAKNSLVAYLGWNFFKVNNNADEEYEPSLYMTYSVCSAYMSIFQAIYEVRDDVEQGINRDVVSIKYENAKRFYKIIRKEYMILRNQCMSAGRYEEMRTNGLIGGKEIDLASKFIGQNYVEMEFEDIENSTTNDAVINTILHVLILIYSGIDIDYEIMGRADEFFDEMQYALQNALRCYKYLLKEDKTYIIEQYTLSFKEKMPSSVAGLAKVLRRQRIQVASLLPLLISAYNEVSRYLIKYPQKQNVEYLKLILENRSDSDKGKEWSWDKEGYNITSETYFIKTLLNFYEYYEQYEECYIEPEMVLKNERQKINEETNRKIEAIKKEWSQDKDALKKIIAEKEKTIRELTLNREPLIKEVISLIDETITKNLDKYLVASLEGLIKQDFQSELGDTISKVIVEKYCGQNLRNQGYNVDDTIIKKANNHISKVLNVNINRTLSGEDK